VPPWADRFPPVRGHLDAATSGVPPLAAVDAVREATAAWAEGRIHGPSFDEPVERARAAWASLVGARPEDVACGANVSVFAANIAATLHAGDEVLLAEGDFTSVLWPALVVERRGVAVRVVALEDLTEAIGARTALVAVSAVQSADGRVLDLGALAAAAGHHGARVLLDVTQGCGWLPVDATRFAYVTGGAYKWLLSPRGTAFLAVRPELLDDLPPIAAGWYAGPDPWTSTYGTPLRLAPTAKRLDVSPSWIAWAGTAPAVELVAELGVEAVRAHDLRLAARLREGLGLEPYDSAILALDRPGAEDALRAAGVRASVRAGRVRLSCHVPATDDDVELALRALSA
jgi:selenocysteine lyase/cysteine desulfurase